MNNLYYISLITLVCFELQRKTNNPNSIFKLIIIYLLLLIFWKTFKISENLETKKKTKRGKKIIKYKRANLSDQYVLDYLQRGIEHDITDDIKNIVKVNSKRKNFEIREINEDIIECPEDLTEFSYLNDEYKFCSDDGKFGDTNNTCALNPDYTKGYPICETYPCPSNLRLINRNYGGHCTNNKYTCKLDAKSPGNFELCYGRENFTKLDKYSFNPGINRVIDSDNNSSRNICENKCIQNKSCNFFTLNKSKCLLYNNIEDSENIKYNKNSDIYFKNPYNYRLEDDVTIEGNTISEHKNMSPQNCGLLCNQDDNCNSFIWGKNRYMGDCILKNNKSDKFKKFDKNYNLYTKKYNFANNIGKLCINPTPKIKSTIDELFDNLDIEYKDRLEQINSQNKIDKKNAASTVSDQIKKYVTNEFIVSNNLVIWDNINIECKTIKITLLKKNFSLQLSNIQVLGVDKSNFDKYMNLLEIRKTKIIPSSGNIDNIKNCTDNNLVTIFETELEENPNIIIKFPRNLLIFKIIIYGGLVNNPTFLYPIKIELIEPQKFVIKQSIDAEFEHSKDPPKLPTQDFSYKSRGITNLGNPDLFRGWVDVSKTGKPYDFCRIVSDEANNNIISCASYNGQNEYSYNSRNGIDLGLKNTAYMKDESGNGRDDYCACFKDTKHNKYNVKCYEAGENSFGEEFYPPNKPSICVGYTGDQLANYNFTTKSNKPKCSSIPEYLKKTKFVVTTGFYNYKKNSYYLLKNTILNNKKVILITLINRYTNKIRRGYPKILTQEIWPNLPADFYSEIDSTMYVGNNSIIIFKGPHCIFYHLNRLIPYYINYSTNTIVYEPDIIPLIRNVFPKMPFVNYVTEAVNIDSDIKSNNDKINIFENLIIDIVRSNKMMNQTNNKNIQVYNLIKEQAIEQNNINLVNKNKIRRFYTKNLNLLHSNEEIAQTMLTKLKKVLDKVKDVNKLLEEGYKLFMTHYIPKCYIFRDQEFVEYSLNIDNIAESTLKKINSKTIENYKHSNINAMVGLYDDPNNTAYIYYKNLMFIYTSDNTKETSLLFKINQKYPKLWDINLLNLSSINNKIYKIQFKDMRNLMLPPSNTNTWEIEIKIFKIVNESQIPLNSITHVYKGSNYSSDLITVNFDFYENKTTIHFNTQNNPSIFFKLLINNILIGTYKESIKDFNNKLILDKNENITFNLINSDEWKQQFDINKSPDENPVLHIITTN